ncbi:uncharacterized protein [Dermacentor albipictus]|uniref:uncharacterized protein n=1 Tax=Dermacentor albipictus TaxID=60249 RepID=UPI0038FC4710
MLETPRLHIAPIGQAVSGQHYFGPSAPPQKKSSGKQNFEGLRTDQRRAQVTVMQELLPRSIRHTNYRLFKNSRRS